MINSLVKILFLKCDASFKKFLFHVGLSQITLITIMMTLFKFLQYFFDASVSLFVLIVFYQHNMKNDYLHTIFVQFIHTNERSALSKLLEGEMLTII